MKVAKKPKVCKAVEAVVAQAQLSVAHHFPTPIYLVERPDFLETVSAVSDEYLAVTRKAQTLNELYPVVMSGSYFGDERMKTFSEFVGMTAWNILADQGYTMQDKAVSFMEMWSQEHHKHSAMDQHVHGYGSQIVGFYFLETPDDCSRLVIHDPRAGKVQIDLPEQDMNAASPASKMINFTPKPGLMVFMNAWLAHSFTRHAAETPIKFVHFNLSVIAAPQAAMPEVEVI